MNPEIFNPNDSSLKGPAEDYLRDPRVTVVAVPATDAHFDPSRKQQLWAYPSGTGDEDALQLRVKPDGSAYLADYFIPGDIASSPNIQENPSKDGYVAKRSPTPLRDLAADEKLVLIRIRAGLIQVDDWWVRKGEPKITASPVAEGFTQADRDVLNAIFRKVTG